MCLCCLLPVIFVLKRKQVDQSCSVDKIRTDIQSDHPAWVVNLNHLQVLHDAFPVPGVAGAPEREGDNLLTPASPLTSSTAQVAWIITPLKPPEIWLNNIRNMYNLQFSHYLKSFPRWNRNLVFWFWYYCHYSGWIYSLSTLTYWPLSLNLIAVISLKILFLHPSAALLIKWMMSAHDDFIINVLSRKLQWCIDFNIVMKWVRQVIMIGEELQAGDLTSPICHHSHRLLATTEHNNTN